MPRQTVAPKQDVVRHTVVSSAANLTNFKGATAPKSQAAGWQDALWDMYDAVGEFQYVANWVGSMCSRARLYVEKDGKEVTTGPAFDAIQELFGSPVGKQEALRTLGIQATVAGESYIFQYAEGGEDVWSVVSPQSVGKVGSVWRVDNRSIPGKPLVVRTWDRHPRRPSEANSSARSALPILSEIFKLTQHIEAQINSRLISGGLLLLPNEMTFSTTQDADEETETPANQSNSDAFIAEFMKVASTAIANRADASATLPMVMTADGEYLDKPRLLEFWSSLDENSLTMRQDSIKRLGLALDVPPEILTGAGDASHWQAWGVDESSIKSHAEPLLMRICGDLTAGYLWHALRGVVPPQDVHLYLIKADTTGLRVRPNRAKEAIELWQNGELSGAAMRRETGFTEDDAPDDKERREFLLRKVAAMAADTSMASQALALLGLELAPAPEAGPTNAEQDSPSTEDVPERVATPGELERRELEDDAKRKSEDAALVAAAEQWVFRALERAGNKAKNQLHFKPEGDIEATEVYLFRKNSDAEASFMLEGAFTQVPRFAARYGVSETLLMRTLEEYTRGLIVNSHMHHIDSLARALERMRVNA